MSAFPTRTANFPTRRLAERWAKNLPWWKKHLGHLKLADVTRAILVEHRGKLARETFTPAKPESARTTFKKCELPYRHGRSRAAVNRYLAVVRKQWRRLASSIAMRRTSRRPV